VIVTAKKQLLLTSGVSFLVSLAGGVASAQSLQGALNAGAQSQSNFVRDRNISVTERAHPGYEALGLRAGAFLLWPKLTVNTAYDDNIFATANDKVADGFSQITPEVDLTSNWSRHSLQAYARGTFNQYWQNSNQNTDDFSLGAKGQLDIERTAKVDAGADYSHLSEPRTAATSAGNPFPIQYNVASLFLSGDKEFNRLRLTGRVDWQHYDYLDRTGNFPQDDRDRTETTVTGRVDYALSPDTALFLEAAGNDHSYRLTSSPIINGAPEFPDFINRDSHGVRVLAGANFELGALMRGEVGVGYLQQNYKDAHFGDVSGPGVRAQVEWFPTQLTTVTLTGARTVEDAGIAGASSYLTSNVGLKVDHELLRNVILNANAGYGEDDYRGIDRHDKRFVGGLGGTYLLNRNVGVTLGYSYYKQNSSGTDPSVALGHFAINKVALSFTLQY
jgi:hypothetical protein